MGSKYHSLIMKLLELLEGLMKRSDPYISGDRSTPIKPKQPITPVTQKTPIKSTTAKSSYQTKIDMLSQKSKIAPEQVAKIWDEERDKIDSKHPQRWSIITSNVKKRLKI